MRTESLSQLMGVPTAKGFFVAFLLGLLFSIALLIPPIQSPDEYQHLYRAQMLSTGQLLLKSEHVQSADSLVTKGIQVGGWVDQGVIDYKNAHWPLVLDPQRTLTVEESDQVNRIQWQNQPIFVDLPGAGYYFPLIYAPQAFGLALGRSLDLGVNSSYWLCRVLTTLTCFALVALSLRMMSPPPLVWALLCLPMSIFQALSPTIDGLTTSLSVVILSLYLNAADNSKKSSWFISMGLVVCIFMVVTTRTHLVVLLALPFYLAFRKNCLRDLWLGVFCALAASLWIAFAIFTTYDGRVIDRSDTTSLLFQYFASPGLFFQMVWVTLNDTGTFLNYQRSFIGVLGWLNVLLPEFSYPLLWSGLAICALLSAHLIYRSVVVDPSSRWVLFFLSVISSGLVFLAMLITWTPTNALLIEGVQGRYFIVPALIMAYALSASEGRLLRSWPVLTWVMVGCFAAASFVSLILALLARYD